MSSLSKKCALAKAIRYALVRWLALTRYTTSGSLEIDNSAAERALRAVRGGGGGVGGVGRATSVLRCDRAFATCHW